MKRRLLWCKGLIAVLTVAIGVLNAFGQNDRAKDDLRRSFRRFELQRVVELPSAASRRLLNVRAGGRDVRLEVEPHDLRSPRYLSEDSAEPGRRRPASREVTTFKGNIAGEPGSAVRVSIDGTAIEGYFTSGGIRFFIEPARKYTNLADDGESVVYKEEDSLIESALLCESDLPAQIEGGKELVMAKATTMALALQDIELATDADQQYIANFGGPSAANNEILNILNMTEGVYQNELNLSITVVYQHTWSTPDPFDGTSMSTLLDSFRNYWNTTIPTGSVPRDAAHLFTGRSAAASAGVAYVGVICRNPGAAYGLSGYLNWAPGKYLIPTHEIGHNLGANHVDAAQSCANTVMNATLTGSTPLTFCTYSRNEIGGFVSTYGSCLTGPAPAPTPTPTPLPPSGSTTRFDFDGDSRADISLFRASTGTWYLSRSTSGFAAFQFGQSGDRAVPADYDGDGRTDAGVYRSGVWYRLKSSNSSYDAVSFGLSDDIPAPADYDGDGRADVAVYRPSSGTWYALNSSTGTASIRQFGSYGDIPVAADHDGDGRADLTVFRPATGVWYRINSGTGSISAVQFGLAGDKPVAGDFDGDGRTDIVVWRPSTGVWYGLRSSNGSFFAGAFGLLGDIPAAADYDGDRKADFAVFRPSTGVWYMLYSSNGSFGAVRFGLSGDVPAPGFYIQ